jgi:hypothetical protein
VTLELGVLDCDAVPLMLAVTLEEDVLVSELVAVKLGSVQGSITRRPAGTKAAADSPQQSIAPAADTAQITFAAPAAMATRGVDDTTTGTGKATLPQHVTAPPSDNEQENVQPAAIAT